MRTVILIFLLLLINFSAYAYEQGEKFEDGMTFLYSQAVEIYGNNWSGKFLTGSKVYILGQGKTVSFDGIIQLNCESSSGYNWIMASNFNDAISRELELSEIVPIQVISAAFSEFCEKP